jgi:hypothetical protein
MDGKFLSVTVQFVDPEEYIMNSPTPVLSLPKANESRFILFTHSIANIK